MVSPDADSPIVGSLAEGLRASLPPVPLPASPTVDGPPLEPTLFMSVENGPVRPDSAFELSDQTDLIFDIVKGLCSSRKVHKDTVVSQALVGETLTRF